MDEDQAAADKDHVAEKWSEEARVSIRSDPAPFLDDPDRLAAFVERLRAAGVKTFAHPSGLQVSFEPTAAKVAAAHASEGW